MKIDRNITDEQILTELGKRLMQTRLQKDLKQSELAEQAGIGLRTLQRLETGAVASRLSSLVRVCQALGLGERLDQLVPEPAASPIALLKSAGDNPRRASGRKAAQRKKAEWTWGESS